VASAPVVRRLHLADARDIAALQALLESAPDYARRITGKDPQPSDAREVLTALPPGLEIGRKLAIGLWCERTEALLGFADVLRGWPRPAVAHIGLLVVHGAHRGTGVGRALHDVVVEQGLAWGEIDTLRLGIVATNATVAEPFWRSCGYAPTGEVKPYAAGTVTSSTAIWERSLAP